MKQKVVPPKNLNVDKNCFHEKPLFIGRIVTFLNSCFKMFNTLFISFYISLHVLKYYIKDVFTTFSNIYDGVFYENR